ncbi:MAG: Phosphohistidine phosphatase SixA [Verrucomicrobiota bacterium]|jgi:phosphohistidine phosphatase
MLLYLIRHAHALDDENDARRILSERGRAQTRAMAGFLRATPGFAPAEIWHSTLVRARETAELLAAGVKLPARLIETPGLRPEDSPGRITPRFDHPGVASVALVGHEPHLSALASLLVAQTPEPRFLFPQCAVLALEGAASYWQVRWHISPDLLPGPDARLFPTG